MHEAQQHQTYTTNPIVSHQSHKYPKLYSTTTCLQSQEARVKTL